MSAPVRIEARAWSDIRFATLARLLGLADSDHALIKVARLWSWQTEHFSADQPTYVLDADTIESVLGSGGAAALVRAKLATEAPGGYRLHGTEGQIEWCGDLSSTRQQAGRVRAAGARRDARGRLLPREHGELDYQIPAAVQQPSSSRPAKPSAPSPSPSPSPSPEDQNLPPARDPAVPSPAPATAPATAPAVPAVSPPATDHRDIAGTQPPGKPATPAETPLGALWSEFELERQRVAKALRIELLPLAAHDRGRSDLAHALSAARAAGELELEVKRIRRAIAVAGAEAEGAQDSQWLTGAVFTADNLRRLSSSTPAKAKQAAAERRSAQQRRAAGPSGKPEAPAMPTPPKISRAAPVEDAVTDAREFQALLERLNDEARAGPRSADTTNDDEPQPRRRKANS